jgi:hypothetical protein
MFLDIIHRIFCLKHDPVLIKKTQCFGDWILSPSSDACLLSWAQSIELVPISGHQHQNKIWYTSQAQHKPSARAKTKH